MVVTVSISGRYRLQGGAAGGGKYNVQDQGDIMLGAVATMYDKMSKKMVFSGYMTIFTLLVIVGFITQMELQKVGVGLQGFLSLAMLFDRFIMELNIVLLMGVLLLGRNVFARIWVYLLSIFFMTVYCVQLASFYQGREYLSKLAIDNMNHVSLLINAKSITGIILLVCLCLLLPILVEKKQDDLPPSRSVVVISTILLIGASLFLHQSEKWLSKESVQYRTAVLKDNYMKHAAPVYALYKTLFSGEITITEEELSRELRDSEIEKIRKFGFTYKKGEKYPYIKPTIYSSPPPFQRKPNTPENTNIIIFFTEGFSARAMDTYGSKYDDVTPHLDHFATQSLVVDNYFNHTAATYRGLHGQNCSIFPYYGGVGGWQTNYRNLPKTDYLCLPQFFNERKYETVFLDAHKKNTSQVDEMMSQLGYGKVLTGKVLSKKYLGGVKPLGKHNLSDGQFFSSLVGYLQEREKTDKVNDPFFMGLYNLGTHAFRKLTVDGKAYGDGSNSSLNTIHNLDNAFGIFWKYFKDSPFAENTIVIFTADHCHYPEKPFVKAFKSWGYQKLFVDTIPLIIFDPTRNLPKRFDARNSTSIDFAPSLIHYLGLDNRRNPFMGTSIYDKDRKAYEGFGVASYGKNLFLIDDKKIHKFGFSNKHFSKLLVLQRYVHETKKLEIENRLWDSPIKKTN